MKKIIIILLVIMANVTMAQDMSTIIAAKIGPISDTTIMWESGKGVLVLNGSAYRIKWNGNSYIGLADATSYEKEYKDYGYESPVLVQSWLGHNSNLEPITLVMYQYPNGVSIISVFDGEYAYNFHYE